MKISTETTAKAFVEMFENTEVPETDRYPAEQDRETIFNHLKFAERLFPKSGLGLCPVSHVNVAYYSANCEQILGHPHAQILKWSLPEFFSRVHPEDLPFVRQCFLNVRTYQSEDPETIRFAIHYRFRNKCNEFQHIRNEQLALQVRQNSYLFLMLYTNISQEEKFYHVKMDVFKRINGSFIKMSTYNPQQPEKEITPRQHDIAKLVTKGYSNQEIADQLGVSIYTVKNHKQMIFRKVNVKNSVELASYVKLVSG